MKLSISTLSFDNIPVSELAQICKENGIVGMEVRTGNGWCVTNTPNETLAQYKKIFSDAGITVFGVGSGIHLRGYTDENMQAFQEHVRFAHGLGATGIRVFIGQALRRRDDVRPPLDYPEIVRWIQTACDYGKDYGVGVNVETHNEFDVGPELRRLLNDVNRTNCKVIWDIMHPIEGHEDIETTLSYLAGDISHIHIKDGVPDPDPDNAQFIYCPIGEGEMPNFDLINLLESNGYDLFYSLEWEVQWRQSLKELDLPQQEVIAHYSKYMNGLYARVKAGK